MAVDATAARVREAEPHPSPSVARWAGAGGLVFLTLVLIQNLTKAGTNPSNTASAHQILTFARQDAWTVHLLFVTYVVGFSALFAFTAGLSRIATQRSAAAVLPARVGQSSVIVIAVLFGLINVIQVTLVAARADLAGDPAMVRALWALHNTVFTLNLVAVGSALLGLGLAATAAGLVPRWIRPLSVFGFAALSIAAMPIVAEVHGSKLLLLGLAGFACWLVFLVVTAVRLLAIRPEAGR